MKYIMFNNDDERIGSYEGRGELSFDYIERQRIQGSHYRLIPEGQESNHMAGWVLDPQGDLQYNQGLATAAQQQETNQTNQGKRVGQYVDMGKLIRAVHEAVVNGNNQDLEDLLADVEEIDTDHPVV